MTFHRAAAPSGSLERTQRIERQFGTAEVREPSRKLVSDLPRLGLVAANVVAQRAGTDLESSLAQCDGKGFVGEAALTHPLADEIARLGVAPGIAPLGGHDETIAHLSGACQRTSQGGGMASDRYGVVGDMLSGEDAAVNKPTFEEVLREYFRRATLRESQTKVADRMGIPRQNLGAILAGKEGREIMPQHVTAYARSSGIPLSEVLFQVAMLSGKIETGSTAIGDDDGETLVDESTARELAATRTRRRRRTRE